MWRNFSIQMNFFLFFHSKFPHLWSSEKKNSIWIMKRERKRSLKMSRWIMQWDEKRERFIIYVSSNSQIGLWIFFFIWCLQWRLYIVEQKKMKFLVWCQLTNDWWRHNHPPTFIYRFFFFHRLPSTSGFFLLCLSLSLTYSLSLSLMHVVLFRSTDMIEKWGEQWRKNKYGKAEKKMRHNNKSVVFTGWRSPFLLMQSEIYIF